MTDDGRWVEACSEGDLALNNPLRVEIDGLALAIVKTDEGIFAVSDTCSHAQWSLSEGEVEDCMIECGLHGARFDLRTGVQSGPPATSPIPTYLTATADGTVRVQIHA